MAILEFGSCFTRFTNRTNMTVICISMFPKSTFKTNTFFFNEVLHYSNARQQNLLNFADRNIRFGWCSPQGRQVKKDPTKRIGCNRVSSGRKVYIQHPPPYPPSYPPSYPPFQGSPPGFLYIFHNVWYLKRGYIYIYIYIHYISLVIILTSKLLPRIVPPPLH